MLTVHFLKGLGLNLQIQRVNKKRPGCRSNAIQKGNLVKRIPSVRFSCLMILMQCRVKGFFEQSPHDLNTEQTMALFFEFA